MNESKNSFMFYPEITDEKFYEKIYLKKEFRDNEIKEKINYDKIFETKKNFYLEPHQTFLKNYISPETPYNGILVFWQTGTGKTCAAISIAEGFKKTLKNMNKKILILTTIPDNFRKELYNFHKERVKKNPEDIVQCTGTAYELKEDSIYLTQQQKENEVKKIIKSYYQFFGYKKFPNYIIKNTGGWKGDEKDINEKIIKFISKEFDNRVIIIDEIQNIKTDKKEDLSRSIQPILQCIIKYAKNIKLILMSATPMFDRPDEIIYYINLLLQNDGRPKINKSEIFNHKDGTLKPEAENKLKNIFRGYISYVRAEKPFIFPFRLYHQNSIIPKYKYYMSGEKIEKNKEIQFLKIILCPMIKNQYDTYYFYLEKKIKEGKINSHNNNLNISFDENIDEENINKNNLNEKKGMGLLSDLTKISNIVYPVSNSNHNLTDIGSFGKKSIDSDFDNGMGGYYKSVKIVGTKKTIQYKYQSHAIFDKNIPFADEKHLNKYSTKFASILNTIKTSKGLIFIFSQSIQYGTLPLALILEQNGIDRYCVEGENQLLDFPYSKEGGRRRQICYLCGKEANYFEHYDEKSKNHHIFKRARYILFFGEIKDIIKIKKEEALKKFCNDKNKYGEEIKIFIGTRTVSEGLDFKMLRQVHIIEPWYNLSRHEQIIGRAIRNLSHKDLLPEEQNVEIFQYAAILDNHVKDKNNLNERESVDLKNYRIAENKDIIIKNINRIMKESAVDCVLFRNANIIDSSKKVKQITSSGQILNNISISDKEYSPICDYKKNCNYECNWMPNPKINYPINTDTYNIKFASNDIDKIKKDIKNMFRQNIVYYLNVIENNILKKYPDIDKLFIYIALEQLVNNKNEVIYDKFSRKGYIIYRGDYYIFQPFDLERDELPLIYRMNPSDIKPEKIELENIELNYENNTENTNYNKLDDSLINDFIKNIDDMSEIHMKIINNNIKLEEKYILSIIETLYDRLNLNGEIFFIKNILEKYLEKIEIKYISSIIYFLNNKNKLINFYSDIKDDKTKTKENLFVGFIVNNKYYIIESINQTHNIKTFKINKINFIEASKELITKIKTYKNLKKNKMMNSNKNYNKIYGKIEFDENKLIKNFKIIDKSSEEKILTKEQKESKRSSITGRIITTFQIKELLELRNKIGMYSIDGKRKKDFLCDDLEIYLRYNRLINKDNKIWIVET